jgi:hypothetical protein
VSGLPDFGDWLEALSPSVAQEFIADGVGVAVDTIADDWRLRTLSSEIRGSIATSVEVENDRVVGKVMSIGEGSYLAVWEEFGTLAHVIMARERGSTGIGKSGARIRGVRTVNAKVRRGALKIGGQLVGELVHHPGAKKNPALHEALDSKGEEAFDKMRDRVAARVKGRIV